MTNEHTQTDGSEARPLTEDPLSLFLIACAVLLGAMYFLEQRSLGQLEDASARARQLGEHEAFTGCKVASAGRRGTVLTVACDAPTGTVAARAAASAEIPPSVSQIVFVGPSGQLVCPSAGEWPTACEARAQPTSEDVARARRGGRPR